MAEKLKFAFWGQSRKVSGHQFDSGSMWHGGSDARLPRLGEIGWENLPFPGKTRRQRRLVPTFFNGLRRAEPIMSPSGHERRRTRTVTYTDPHRR